MRQLLRTFIVIAAFGLTTAAAMADGSSMPVLGATSQPVGHYEFCRRHNDECQRNAEVGLVKLTRATWSKIVEVNDAVNASIFPRTDEEMFGVPEYWTYPSVEGDCEDFVLLKQYMLERAGFPRSALLITVARQPNGDGHAVLTLRTDQGDFILDNLQDRVLAWTSSDLRFLKRQSERNAGKWTSIGDDRDTLVGSVR